MVSLTPSQFPSLDSNTKLDIPTAGDKVYNSIKALYVAGQALEQLARTAKNDGTHLVCASASLAAGISSLLSGNLVSGPLLAACGANELLKMFSKNDNRDIHRLLQDASAGTEMVDILQRANERSCTTIESNLVLIERHVKELEGKLKEVRTIATEGFQEIEAQKKVVIEKLESSIKVFQFAQFELQKNKKDISQSSQELKEIIALFDQIFKIAQNKNESFEDRLNKFLILAKNASRKAQEAQMTLNRAESGADVVAKLLEDALKSQNEAFSEALRIISISSNRFKRISENAAVGNTVQPQIDSTKNELANIRQRFERTKRILENVRNDIEEADRNAYTARDVVLGGVGAVVGSPLGTASMIAGWALGTMLSRFGATLVNVAAKVNHIVVGAPNEPPLDLARKVKFDFDKQSSGYVGWWNKSQSWTVGTITIQTGNQVKRYGVNLNENNKLSRKDTVDLVLSLMNELELGHITAQRCLEIINSLETIQIDRGPRNQVVTGLLDVNSDYLAELKQDCQNLIKAG